LLVPVPVTVLLTMVQHGSMPLHAVVWLIVGCHVACCLPAMLPSYCISIQLAWHQASMPLNHPEQQWAARSARFFFTLMLDIL
jgi:hypothetical protein